MTECTHPNKVTSDANKGGVMTEVTACPDCGAELDARKLDARELEAPGIPPEEAAIQSQARIDKAEEVGLPGLAAKLREESGEMDALPAAPVEVVIEAPTDEQVRESLEGKVGLVKYLPWNEVNRAALAGWTAPVVLNHPAPCAKQGGEFAECDTGPGKAHHCTNSKWGKVGTFGGPCRCYTCHEPGDALA